MIDDKFQLMLEDEADEIVARRLQRAHTISLFGPGQSTRDRVLHVMDHLAAVERQLFEDKKRDT